jgi:hypothetical protein
MILLRFIDIVLNTNYYALKIKLISNGRYIPGKNCSSKFTLGAYGGLKAAASGCPGSETGSRQLITCSVKFLTVGITCFRLSQIGRQLNSLIYRIIKKDFGLLCLLTCSF